MPRSRHVRPLNAREREQLTDIYQNHASFPCRQRAHAVLLSAKGYNLKDLQGIFGVNRDTVSEWLDRFEASGADGLANLSRAGRPSIYTADDIQHLKDFIDAEPRHPKQAQARLESLTGKTSCTETVKRAIKKNSGTSGADAGSRPRTAATRRTSNASRPTKAP
jgi:transposase